MTEQDRPAFARLLAGLGEVYRQPFSQAQAEIYWRALRPEPREALSAAVTALIRSSQYLPRPSEILAETRRQRLQVRDTTGPMPEARPALMAPDSGEVRRRRQEDDRNPAVGAAAAMARAWRERQASVKAGVPVADADELVAEAWREHMPLGREEVWHYYCDDCRDSGLVRYWANDREWHRPCACPKGEPWQIKARAADETPVRQRVLARRARTAETPASVPPVRARDRSAWSIVPSAAAPDTASGAAE